MAEKAEKATAEVVEKKAPAKKTAAAKVGA